MKQALVTRSRLATHVRNVQHGTSSRNKEEEEEEEGRDHSSLLFFLISSPFMGLFFLNAVFFFPLPLFFQSHTSPLPSLPLSLQKQIRDIRKTAL